MLRIQYYMRGVHMANEKSKTGFLSLLRIVSAFAVVVIHVVATSIVNRSGDVSECLVYVLNTVSSAV